MNIENNYNHFGSYELLTEADKTVISNESELITIKQRITGSGKIDYKTVKIVFSISSDILNQKESSITHGFKKSKDKKDTIVTWGGEEQDFSEVSGYIITLSSVIIDNENEELIHSFSRQNENTTIIHSEVFYKMPLLLYKLKLKKKLSPGNYSLKWVMTYFDGDRWQSKNEILEIKVLSWYERQESSIQIFAWVIVFLTIFSFILSLPSFYSDWIDLLKNNKEEEISNPIKKIDALNKKDSINIKQETKKVKKKK